MATFGFIGTGNMGGALAQTGYFTNNLDNLNLLSANLGQLYVELGLLFCCFSRTSCCYNNASCCGYTELLLASLYEII